MASIRSALLAAVFFMAGFVPVANAQTPSLGALDVALASGQWQTAAQIASQLDARVGRGDIMAAYAAAVRHATHGQCEEAATLADLVIGALPVFAPAYSVSYRCHSALGRRDIAIQRLETLVAILPQGPERDFVSQLLQNEKSKDRPAFSGYVTVAPSSNVNRQTSATTMPTAIVIGGVPVQGTIPDSSRGQAGVLFTAGGSMAMQLASYENLTISGVLRTDIRFSTASETFEPSFTAELPMTFRLGGSIQAVVAPYATVGFTEWEHSLTEGGVRSTVSIPITAQQRLAINLKVGALDRPLNPARSGVVADGSAALSSVLTPNVNLTTTARLRYDYTDTPTLRTLEATLAARVDTLLDNGLVLGFEGTVGQRYHSRPAPLTLGPDQIDTFATLRSEASHREIAFGPFMPSVYYQYSRSWSDNVFYTYESHDVGLTVRSSF